MSYMAFSSFFNTLKLRQIRRHFADYSFKCIILNENIMISIKISLNIIPKGPINNIPALVPICVTWPQWVKVKLGESEFIVWKPVHMKKI